jgi:hypothetical protein
MPWHKAHIGLCGIRGMDDDIRLCDARRRRAIHRLQDLRDEIEWGPNVEHPTIMQIARRVAALFRLCSDCGGSGDDRDRVRGHLTEFCACVGCGGTGIAPDDTWWSYPAALHSRDLARYLFGEDGCRTRPL